MFQNANRFFITKKNNNTSVDYNDITYESSNVTQNNIPIESFDAD